MHPKMHIELNDPPRTAVWDTFVDVKTGNVYYKDLNVDRYNMRGARMAQQEQHLPQHYEHQQLNCNQYKYTQHTYESVVAAFTGESVQALSPLTTGSAYSTASVEESLAKWENSASSKPQYSSANGNSAMPSLELSLSLKTTGTASKAPIVKEENASPRSLSSSQGARESFRSSPGVYSRTPQLSLSESHAQKSRMAASVKVKEETSTTSSPLPQRPRDFQAWQNGDWMNKDLMPAASSATSPPVRHDDESGKPNAEASRKREFIQWVENHPTNHQGGPPAKAEALSYPFLGPFPSPLMDRAPCSLTESTPSPLVDCAPVYTLAIVQAALERSNSAPSVAAAAGGAVNNQQHQFEFLPPRACSAGIPSSTSFPLSPHSPLKFTRSRSPTTSDETSSPQSVSHQSSESATVLQKMSFQGEGMDDFGHSSKRSRGAYSGEAMRSQPVQKRMRGSIGASAEQ